MPIVHDKKPQENGFEHRQNTQDKCKDEQEPIVVVTNQTFTLVQLDARKNQVNNVEYNPNSKQKTSRDNHMMLVFGVYDKFAINCINTKPNRFGHELD